MTALTSHSNLPYILGNSDDFRLGNGCFLLGNMGAGISERLGHITQLEFLRYGPRGEITETK